MHAATRTSALLLSLAVAGCSGRDLSGTIDQSTGPAASTSDDTTPTASASVEPSTAGGDVTAAATLDTTSAGALDEASTTAEIVCPLHEAREPEVSFESETLPPGLFGSHFGPASCEVVTAIGPGASLDCVDPRDSRTVHRVELLVAGVEGFSVTDLPPQIELEHGETDGFESCKTRGLRLADPESGVTILVVSDRYIDEVAADWTAAVVGSSCTAWLPTSSSGTVECRPGALDLDTPDGPITIDEGDTAVAASGHLLSAFRARDCRWSAGSGGSDLCGEILYTVVAPRRGG